MVTEAIRRELYLTRVRDNNSGYYGTWAKAHVPSQVSLKISGDPHLVSSGRDRQVGVA